MTDLRLERFELEGANVFCARLLGVNRFAQSRENAAALAERLVREQRDGLILDYRACTLDHTIEQFAEIAEIFIARVPKTCRIAYVYGPDNMMHALVMTKRLKAAGYPAAAFADWEGAEGFARKTGR
ncbi:hypothetical protein E5163_02450 [Marinicauda algicola]|uniref:STAS/SEC14 domain-containing protein n=1 Tax=Marinicauda algicola TaxID=2029849 RepID=A0A4S2H3R8_9PROT|nr:hypothetical protein [Marinicauda algicola]TGY90011.1 hypothetical protein E5163_02450 [Marinicauda algicola]